MYINIFIKVQNYMLHKLFNYEITEPEENTFVDICADITHKCNMTCKNCYIPSREPPDMDLDRFKDFMCTYYRCRTYNVS